MLAACHDSSQGSATPLAAEEFAQLQQIPLDPNDPMDQEWQNVLTHFEQHMDVHYKTPKTNLTILHLAAIFNKKELVRCLILDGADPNARTQFLDNADTAVKMSLSDISTNTPNSEAATRIIDTIDTLLQGGATPETEKDIITHAISLCEHEDAVLHLLRKLPIKTMPREDEAYLVAAWKGWNRTLNFLFNAHLPDNTILNKALFTAAAGSFRTNGQHTECINRLLQLGADVNARDEAARTPLFAAASSLLQTETTEAERVLNVISLLLKNGADIALNSRDEEYPDCCAYDLLLMHPMALNKLEELGHTIQAPPLAFAPGVPLLSDICKAQQRKQTPDETLRYFSAISSIFTPTPEMEESHIYPEALENAILLLCQANCNKTVELITNMQLWHNPATWLTNEHTTQALISAIHREPSLVLPQELLEATATKLTELGLQDEAATLIEWMGRDTNARAAIESLTQNEHPAIRAGAWAATLLQKKLPLPRNGEIRQWLEKHPQIDQKNPAVQKALLLTSLEELWYGNLPSNKQKQLIAAMREIGAPQAAAQYEKIAENLHNPDVLDEIMSQPNNWKFELETATAQYIIAHQSSFLLPNKENTD